MLDIGSTSLADDQPRKALEAFVIENAELERLESLLDQFNLFEAIGAVRQELRHSDFLAFLLNPRQNHGLGDLFAKRLLQKVIVAAGGTVLPISPIDLDVWSLDTMLVLREWENIDILLLDESHQLAVIIENKIDTTEHSGQLQRYRHAVRLHYPNCRILGVFLTPDGVRPSDELYLPLDYGTVAELVKGIAEQRASALGVDVRTLLLHYVEMLRRHIVSESDIAELCRAIYRKHQRALDLIYEYRPDQQALIHEVLERIINETPGLALDRNTKSVINFTASEWDVPLLTAGNGWTKSGRMLLFEFTNQPTQLRLKLIIGPGPQETRVTLLDAFRTTPKFGGSYAKLWEKWNSVYSRAFLTARSYEDASTDDLEREIRKQWSQFVQSDLPPLLAAVKSVMHRQPVA